MSGNIFFSLETVEGGTLSYVKSRFLTLKQTASEVSIFVLPFLGSNDLHENGNYFARVRGVREMESTVFRSSVKAHSLSR